MRSAIWYFDFISPCAWIGLHRLTELPPDVSIEYRPVLFAGILGHWGQKGPAEIPTKRRYTYRWSHWWAQSQGIALRYPAGHPFNPIHHLRLALACGCRRDAIQRIFESIWTTGADAGAAFSPLMKELGVKPEEIEKPEIKNGLRTNTEEAIRRGVFGVPTLEIDGELFWGADSMEFAKAFLQDPSVLRNAEIQRLDDLPVTAARKT
jgi:2-hydroxychromene-2-carboxylate isomerase